MYRTILGFDTSALNALHRAGPDVAPMLAGLDTGYAVRLNGTALDEIVAHSLPEERERLRKLCRKLLANGAGDVLLPFHEITTRLAVTFESGHPFDWTRVDVRSNEYMRFIFAHEVSVLFEEDADYETVSLEQRISAVDTAGQFDQVFLAPRPIFQKLGETGKESWPKSAAELAEALQKPGGAYWNYAIGLYHRATGVTVDEEKIRRFVRECPPFRALLAAIVFAQYERSISEEVKPKLAGRNDLFMAGYLPYCDEFVSNDHAQQQALREIVSIAQLATSVRWHKEFSGQFSLRSAATI